MDWESIIGGLFEVRNESILSQDKDKLKTIFLISERNGLWAYQNELRRLEYLYNWAEKQGAKMLSITSTMQIRRSRQVGRGYSFYIVCSNEYRYAYIGDMQAVNIFRLGTYHSLDLIPLDDGWIISREWYDDPLSGKLDLSSLPDNVTENILAQKSENAPDLSDQRAAAVEYADYYCGAASDGQNNYKYNTQYTDYNALGGDCANFVSQVLYESGGFKKNGSWNYKDGKGSLAWIKAQNLTDFMLYNGRETLISKGNGAVLR